MRSYFMKPSESYNIIKWWHLQIKITLTMKRHFEFFRLQYKHDLFTDFNTWQPLILASLKVKGHLVPHLKASICVKSDIGIKGCICKDKKEYSLLGQKFFKSKSFLNKQQIRLKVACKMAYSKSVMQKLKVLLYAIICFYANSLRPF